MTLKEATEAEIEVWRYLAKHPEIKRRHNLPEELFGGRDEYSHKPLCCYAHTKRDYSCAGCPMHFTENGRIVECDDINHPRWLWLWTGNKRLRKTYANRVVKILKAALAEMDKEAVE
jgi:hypothetical protein